MTMTQLCYSLEEAALKLNLSETVLVRLSQYFKVPAAAYEEAGYLSFKGDLVFPEPDLAFFRKVKERLVAGDSLEEAKRKLANVAPPVTVVNQPIQIQQQPPKNPQEVGGLREIQDPAPYHKAAEQSFERYKSTHRTGLSRVFEKMIKEVTDTAAQKKPSAPEYKPMRHKMEEPGATASKERVLPFQRGAASNQTPQREQILHKAQATTGKSARSQYQNQPPTQAPNQEPGWEQLIQDAVAHPRVLNQQLKSAALLLRQQSLQRQQYYSS